MTRINLYLVDDKVARVCFLRDLVCYLNNQSSANGAVFADGFADQRSKPPLHRIGETIVYYKSGHWGKPPTDAERREEQDYHTWDTAALSLFDCLKSTDAAIRANAEALRNAIADPYGIILLDIRLTAAEQTPDAMARLAAALGIARESDDDFMKIWKCLNNHADTLKAALILTTALRQRRPVILVSSAKDEMDREFVAGLRHLGLQEEKWPEENWFPENEDVLIKKLKIASQSVLIASARMTFHADSAICAAIELFCQPWTPGWKDHEDRERMWHHNYLTTSEGRESLRIWLGCKANELDDRSAKGLLMTAWDGPNSAGIVWPEFARSDCRPISEKVLRKVFERLEIDVKAIECPVDLWMPVTPGLPWLISLRSLLWWIEHENSIPTLPSVTIRGERGTDTCNVFTFTLSLHWTLPNGDPPWKLANRVDELRREYEKHLVATQCTASPVGSDRRQWFGTSWTPGKTSLSGYIVKFLHGQISGLRVKEGAYREPLWQLEVGRSVPIVQVEWPSQSELRLRWFGTRE